MNSRFIKDLAIPNIFTSFCMVYSKDFLVIMIIITILMVIIILLIYLSWSLEMQVTNGIVSMKWSKKKQLELANYIFPCCFALAPSSPLLTGFGVHSLLAGLLCQLASMEEVSFWEYAHSEISSWEFLKIGISLGPYNFYVAQIFPLYSLEHMSSSTTSAISLFDCLG